MRDKRSKANSARRMNNNSRHTRKEAVTRKYKSTLEIIPECRALRKCDMEFRAELKQKKLQWSRREGGIFGW
jgi:hypothetical protein